MLNHRAVYLLQNIFWRTIFLKLVVTLVSAGVRAGTCLSFCVHACTLVYFLVRSLQTVLDLNQKSNPKHKEQKLPQNPSITCFISLVNLKKCRVNVEKDLAFNSLWLGSHFPHLCDALHVWLNLLRHQLKVLRASCLAVHSFRLTLRLQGCRSLRQLLGSRRTTFLRSFLGVCLCLCRLTNPA
jgi:hypothetical protein